VHAIVRQEVVSTVFCHCYIGEEVDLEVLCGRAITMYGKEVNTWRSVFQHTGEVCKHTHTHAHTSLHVPPNEENVLQVRQMLCFWHEVSIC